MRLHYLLIKVISRRNILKKTLDIRQTSEKDGQQTRFNARYRNSKDMTKNEPEIFLFLHHSPLIGF